MSKWFTYVVFYFAVCPSQIPDKLTFLYWALWSQLINYFNTIYFTTNLSIFIHLYSTLSYNMKELHTFKLFRVTVASLKKKSHLNLSENMRRWLELIRSFAVSSVLSIHNKLREDGAVSLIYDSGNWILESYFFY